MPDEALRVPPTAVRQPLDYGGNEVVLQIAPGVFAIYAHLQPGSIQVHERQTVTTRQVLGLLGNTGNSAGPHLHFQLANSPDIMTSDSLPFVLDAWTLTGTAALDVTTGEATLTGASQDQHKTFPLDLDVATFS
jgi:murein DD-endopeptidase MepM/ murein hydrolase activator NlpD